MELFILMAPALSELWSSLIDCSHSCGKLLVMNESRKNREWTNLFLWNEFWMSGHENINLWGLQKNIKSISAIERSESIRVCSQLKSINFHRSLFHQNSQIRICQKSTKLDRKWDKQEDGRLPDHRFPVTKAIQLWLCWAVALVSFALQTLSHLRARLKPFCNHLLVDLLTN